jgi:hypothetical protein
MSPPNRSGHRFPPCSTSPRPHALATTMTLSPRQRREAKSFSPTLHDTSLALCHPLCSACSSATANPTVPPRLPPTAAVATERLRLYQVCPVLEPHSAIVRSHRSEPTPIAFLGHEDLPAPALYAPSPASSPPPHQRPSSPPAHHLGTTSSVSPSLPTTQTGSPTIVAPLAPLPNLSASSACRNFGWHRHPDAMGRTPILHPLFRPMGHQPGVARPICLGLACVSPYEQFSLPISIGFV